MSTLLDAFVVSIVPPAIRRQAHRRRRELVVTVAMAALAGAVAFVVTAVTIVARHPERFERFEQSQQRGKIPVQIVPTTLQNGQNERPATFEERFSAVYDVYRETSPTWANSGEKLAQLTWRSPQLAPINLVPAAPAQPSTEAVRPAGFSRRTERDNADVCTRHQMRRVWLDRWRWRCRRVE